MADFPVRNEIEVQQALASIKDRAKKKRIHKGRRQSYERGVATLPAKLCRGPCQMSKVLDQFDKDRSKPDGHKDWCKECRKKRDVRAGEDAITQAIMDLDDELLARVAGSPTGGTNLPHQVQAMEAILARLGGVEGLATYAVANMLAAPPGSQMREKFLSKIISLIQTCSDDGKVSKPRDLMSDEELKQMTEARMKRLGLIVEAVDVREAG